jgi:hypothetical protein
MARLNGDFAGGGFRSQDEFDFYAKWIELNRLPCPSPCGLGWGKSERKL